MLGTSNTDVELLAGFALIRWRLKTFIWHLYPTYVVRENDATSVTRLSVSVLTDNKRFLGSCDNHRWYKDMTTCSCLGQEHPPYDDNDDDDDDDDNNDDVVSVISLSFTASSVPATTTADIQSASAGTTTTTTTTSEFISSSMPSHPSSTVSDSFTGLQFHGTISAHSVPTVVLFLQFTRF